MKNLELERYNMCVKDLQNNPHTVSNWESDAILEGIEKVLYVQHLIDLSEKYGSR